VGGGADGRARSVSDQKRGKWCGRLLGCDTPRSVARPRERERPAEKEKKKGVKRRDGLQICWAAGRKKRLAACSSLRAKKKRSG
jgi:hypothetical protein